jgi:hypothetical protein
LYLFKRVAAPVVAATAATTFFAFASGGQARAQSLTPVPPAPAPSPTASAVAKPHDFANALKLSGYLRAYDFDRINRVQNPSNPNRSAFNVGTAIQLDYHILNTPLYAGVGFYGSYPFGANGIKPAFNSQIDNTLPGFSTATLGLAYLRYDDTRLRAVIGDQLYDSPWAPASDSRLKPALYQGIDAKYAIDRHFDVGLSRMVAFESRTSSDYQRYTLLTSTQPGNPTYTNHPTSGFLVADAAYHNGGHAFASVYNYSFYDIANLTYAEAGGGLAPASPYHPTVAAQYVNESQAGQAFAGKIQNETYGAKLSADLNRNASFSFGFDDAPYHYADVTAASAAAAGKAYFLPGGGTGTVAALGGGVYRVAYGGIASPYTDAYASDPIYTTSISQGAVDRHSAGPSYKAALTFQSDNKRVKAILSEAYYRYDDFAALNNTYETDVDVTYYFSPVKRGPYRGLSFRERFADRSQATLPYEFQYVRSQLQYQF